MLFASSHAQEAAPRCGGIAMAATGANGTQYFEVGTARACITPAVGLPYLGGGWDRQEYFLGVNDDLWAKALFVSDGDECAVLVACDMIGFPPAAFAAAVRERVATHAKIPAENVMLSASHTHSSHGHHRSLHPRTRMAVGAGTHRESGRRGDCRVSAAAAGDDQGYVGRDSRDFREPPGGAQRWQGVPQLGPHCAG